jgi:hypothetical protein
MIAIAALLAWHQATRIDRQVGHESSSRQREPDGVLGFALGALLTAVAAAMLLQTMVLPRVVP